MNKLIQKTSREKEFMRFTKYKTQVKRCFATLAKKNELQRSIQNIVFGFLSTSALKCFAGKHDSCPKKYRKNIKQVRH